MEIFADLHVHIGRAENGKPIKITAAKSLNFANIAHECFERKGIEVVGVIDCQSPYVIEDIENFLKSGDAYEIEDGGIIYKDRICIILGSEVETVEVGRNGKKGAAHNLCYFPHLKDIKAFSKELSNHLKNITLSTQKTDLSGYELLDIVEKYNGVLIPAHCFTPFKSYYGNCADRLKDIFKEKFDKIFAIELGLSSDTELADMISELETKRFVTNSDAHSLPKIAREYNKLKVEDISFKEVMKAVCPHCGSDKVTFGVYDRIKLIRDKEVSKSPKGRPEYIYQVPLGFIPGVGPKAIDKLLNTFGLEMTILNKLDFDDIEAVVGEKIAKLIIDARGGNLKIESGGGGNYGRVKKD